MTWEIVNGNDAPGNRHVIPLDDLRKHRRSIDCWCHPVFDDQVPSVVIHNAMDLREQFEEGRQ